MVGWMPVFHKSDLEGKELSIFQWIRNTGLQIPHGWQPISLPGNRPTLQRGGGLWGNASLYDSSDSSEPIEIMGQSSGEMSN